MSSASIGSLMNIIPQALENQLPYLLRTASDKVQDAVRRHLESLNIDAREYEVMALVDGDEINQITVAGAVRVNRNAMVRLTDSLEEKGMLRREVNSDNRREHLLRLTEDGHKILRQAEKIIRGTQERVIEILDVKSQKMLCECLKKIVQAEDF